MTANMKLKTLQGHLQQLDGFSNPKLELEQYATPPHIAAIVLYNIQTQFEDIDGSLVLDAGCGPGALSIGAALLGAACVTSVDIDEEALDVYKENVTEMEITNVDALQCDFVDPSMLKWENFFDTVIMNPPFGTKSNSGIDIQFLKMGTMLSSGSVYSMHKTTTRSHIKNKVKEWGMKGNVVAELVFDLPLTYRFHKRQTLDIAVDLWRVYS